MKKLKALILSIFLAFSLPACKYFDSTQEINDVLLTVEQLTHYYNDGNLEGFFYQVDFSDEEYKTINDSVKVILSSKEVLNRFKNNPTFYLSNINLVKFEFFKVKDAYIDIRNIAINHQEEYPIPVWNTFELIDIHAIRLEEKFNKLIDSVESNAATMSALELTNTVIRLIALM